MTYSRPGMPSSPPLSAFMGEFDLRSYAHRDPETSPHQFLVVTCRTQAHVCCCFGGSVVTCFARTMGRWFFVVLLWMMDDGHGHALAFCSSFCLVAFVEMFHTVISIHVEWRRYSFVSCKPHVHSFKSLEPFEEHTHTIPIRPGLPN